jgi:hypothetical protein
MAGAQHGLRELAQFCMAWATAWTRHGMCELALRFSLVVLVAAEVVLY